jgi:hypothetical protein
MINYPHCSVKKIDEERCFIDVHNNVMECPSCCFLLDKINTINIESIVDSLDNLPEKITLIQIPVLPTPANRKYFSFEGIEEIVLNLLKSQNKKHIAELKKGETYLKVFYKKDPLFTILPIIMIEIIIFKELHEQSIDELLKTLKAEVLFFTGSVGDIDIIEIKDIEDLIKLLQIPLLLGQPEFKKEGALLKHQFSIHQIKEMNYIHSVSLIKLKMNEVINNNQLNLFEIYREAIQNEINERNQDIQNFIDGLPPYEEINYTGDNIKCDDLPF